MSGTALTVENLSVSYGRVEALHTVSLTLPPGRIVTVIGPNGAGKTTLLNAVMGVLPSRGDIRLNGGTIDGEDIETRVAMGLCLVPETRALFAEMSVEDNLRLGAFARRRRPGVRLAQDLAEIYLRFPRLHERRRQFAATLSGGERQMLALGRALMARPTVLMLDEPSLGLAPLIVREVFRLVAGLRDASTAILLVEQNARAALEVADYGYVLETGRVALEGPAADLAADSRVVDTYLGGSSGH